ncbi:hypothetical protein RHMOL_Rhmol04G0072400 [Rhododendron molle]|uniref:Uncharacterized protein n=2 Tax=Rhododendron molle TaxID=49168 RepID=A0ACC0NZ30_RHOML|nr:hypothetical protein RHMOL_Rhmol04G0072400 [Rhododendron molle]KAI8558211.1 hypothetical protein RHMOL_Rhmol04G0072400 [Rhododendron molle]
MGEKPSTAGNVYSYGIKLLVLFTGKSSNHESSTADLSFKIWVQLAFGPNVDQVLDPGLVPNNCSAVHSITSEARSYCYTAVLGVGLAYIVDLPDGRISMRDARGQSHS